MDLQTLHLDIKDGVGLVTMDNPPVNATSLVLMQEITRVFDSFNDAERRAVAALSALGTTLVADHAQASSHREAPFITKNPKVVSIWQLRR